MSTPKKSVFIFNKKYLLLALLMTTLAVGAVWLKYHSPYGPNPLLSSADEPSPHWPHSAVPFKLDLNNHTSSVWNKSISDVTTAWSSTDKLIYRAVTESRAPQCYPIVLPPPYQGLHVCSYREENGFLGIYTYFQRNGEDPHISSALVALNDHYLNNPGSEYSTAAWRNKTLCWGLGWTAGLPIHLDPPEEADSCLNIYVDFKTVANQQFPSSTDHENLRTLYSHVDPLPDESDGAFVIANRSLSAGDFGELTGSFNGGRLETYQLDLGNDHILKTLVIKVGP